MASCGKHNWPVVAAQESGFEDTVEFTPPP